MTFWGDYRGHGTPHESPKVITVPLVILAGCAVAFGFLNFPTNVFGLELPGSVTTRFEHYVEPTFAFPAVQHAEFTPWLAVVSTILAVTGLFIAYAYYERNRGPHGLTHRNKAARAGYTFLENKYYLDTLYTDIIAADTKGPLARAAYWFNQNVLDGIIDGTASVSKKVSGFVYRDVDQFLVDGVVNGTGLVSDESGQFLRRMQTGKVQQYAAILFAGVVVLAGVLVFVV
jgi:NADH-quinone oxidoreductase subunit L